MGTRAQATSFEKPVPSVARQPILAGDERVLGYELLFRQSPEDENLITSDVPRSRPANISAGPGIQSARGDRQVALSGPTTQGSFAESAMAQIHGADSSSGPTTREPRPVR